jgi:S-adenosylmethionine synthetase
MQRADYVFASESVAEGHPDKICDRISDTIVDAYLAADPASRVAAETLATTNRIVIAGEVRGPAEITPERIEQLARGAVREVGYEQTGFHWAKAKVKVLLHAQSADIAQGVDAAGNKDEGAGDQGIMFGYASNESDELMPLPIVLAHKLTKGLADDRRAGVIDWLRPDAKSQVSVIYEGGAPKEVSHVLVSTQHKAKATATDISDYVRTTLAPRVLGQWFNPDAEFLVNPSGSFTHGGPSADCGVTGRKIIVDSYGGMGRHGGGAFSGKDPSKVDRSGAYFCRHVARSLVGAGIADRAEIQVSYAIGRARPMSVKVDTFGTGDEREAAKYTEAFDFRPSSIIKQLGLLRPIYRQTTNYGHFGRPGLPWEQAKTVVAV